MMNDYINRTKAIREVLKWASDASNPQFLVKSDVVYVLSHLPSDDMEICTKCGHLRTKGGIRK